MNGPDVSILMPVHNEEKFLPAALASLFQQSLKRWELVAVDDGSTDRTPEILNTAARRDPRVRVASLPRRGVAAALNEGLLRCKASLVARMDADDVSHPRRLERQVAHMVKHPEVTVLGSAFRHFPRRGLTQGMAAYERWQNTLSTDAQIRRDLFVESPFVHPSVVFRREAVLGIGAYRDAGWAEDYDLWLRLAAAQARFFRLPETLLFWRDRPERVTRTAPTCTADAFRACKAHHLCRGFLKDAQSVTLWGAGIEGKAWRRELAARGVKTVRWLEIDPRKIGQRIHEAPVDPIEALRPGEGPVLITVGAPGARAQIRAFAAAAGLTEGKDFVCVT